jgi:hypothetical protein
MKATFTVPDSKRIRIEYNETFFQGKPCTPYLKTTEPVDNPGSTAGVQNLMLARHVGLGHIVRCVPVAPRPDFVRPGPAEHKAAQYIQMANA